MYEYILEELLLKLPVIVTHHFVGHTPKRKKFSKIVLNRQPATPCNHQLAHYAISLPPDPAMCSLTHLS